MYEAYRLFVLSCLLLFSLLFSALLWWPLLVHVYQYWAAYLQPL